MMRKVQGKYIQERYNNRKNNNSRFGSMVCTPTIIHKWVCMDFLESPFKVELQVDNLEVGDLNLFSTY